jgi:hypothetical protein
MKRTFLMFLFVLILSGCSFIPLDKQIEITERTGKERTFDCPYEKVFYAAEDGLNAIGGSIPWQVDSSDIHSGRIIISNVYCHGVILVKKVSENVTSVKIQQFGTFYFDYQKFFRETERRARRKD